MLTVIIGFLAFVVLIASAGDGEWGAFAVVAVIVGILMLASHEERRDVKAWMNCRDYWADGGPDRKK